MKHFRVVVWTLLFGLVVVPVVAAMQGLQCPDIVRLALDATNARCDRTDRNQACYGHILLDADPQPGVDNFAFEQEGDIVDLVKLASMRLSPLDEETGLWGVSLMRLQPNVEDLTPGEHVTFLLFGDVEITNAVPAPAVRLMLTTAASGNVVIRQEPSSRAGSWGTLISGQPVIANGRLADASWLRVEVPDINRTGWVYAPLMSTDGDLDTLEIVDTTANYYSPMQAFYFRSGNDAPCSEAGNGLLVQTPQGLAEITLLMNEVNIQLRATAYLQAQPGDELTIDVLEGWADITAQGETQTIVGGTRGSVPLDENGAPSAPPSAAAPYDNDSVGTLPVDYLGTDVAVSPALSEEEIPAAIEAVNRARGRNRGSHPGRGHGRGRGNGGGPPPGRGGGNGRK